ncbi:MAG: TolC family protein [Ignavibacteriales bacterium]|nr:TolC family protein [Ignavibacteriales bacterium]
MKKTAVLLTFSFLLSQAIAQPVDSLIQEAYKNNPQLKSFEYKIQATGFRASSASAWPAPTLGIEFSQIPSNSTNILNDAISNNLSISQMFMLGGKLSAMSEMEKRKGRVLEQNLGSFQVQLRAKIKMNYYQLWLLDRQIEVQQRTLSLLNELVQNMQSHVMINRMRQADLFTIQAEVASEKSNLSEMKSKRANVQNVVNSLLGRNDFTQAIRTDSILAHSSVVLSEFHLSEQVKQANPSLIAMDRMKEMNEAEITSANRELFPDVMLQAMVMRMPNGMILTGGPRSMEMIQQSVAGMAMQKTDWMYSVMASITLPFAPWASERSTAKADEMRSTNLSIEAEKNAMQREMIASLRSALNRYTTADSLARQYQSEILPLTHQSAEAQTVAYQTGQVPITTVLDSRRLELMKQDDYIMVLMDRQMALVEIEMMVGAPLQ